MTNQTIKINGLADYSPITAELQIEYNSLKTNVSKRRLVLDCLRNGYALEKMGLGELVALLERQGFVAMTEREKCERFLALSAALTATQILTPAPAAKPADVYSPEYTTEVTRLSSGPASAPQASSTSVTVSEDEMTSKRVERAPESKSQAALKLGRTNRS